MHRNVASTVSILITCSLAACASEPDGPSLDERAYVVAEGSSEIFVLDLADMRELGRIDIGLGELPNANHMAVLGADARRLYVTATHYDAVVAVDLVAGKPVASIPVGAYPTHASLCAGCAPGGGDELWVVNEHDRSLSIVDLATDQVSATLADPAFVVPHFVRFAGGRAYLADIGGNQIAVIDVAARRVVDWLLLEGLTVPGPCSGDPCGFADAQIAPDGMLVAAHIESGRVVRLDTVTGERAPDLTVGSRPWAVFADTSAGGSSWLMPNWGDATVSILDGAPLREVARSGEGDRESHGVNYSPVAPELAFVLNHRRARIAVVDRASGDLVESLAVGGTTETASTTADGRHLLLPLSSTDELLVLDVASRTEVVRIPNVGRYPWSVVTPGGQNYCH